MRYHLETLISIKPFLAVLVSTIGAGLILASDRKPNLREGWSVGAGVIKLLIVLSMAPAVLAGQTIEYTLFTFLPGFDIKFRVDPLGLLFATVASSLWIVTSFYSIGYMRSTHEHKQTRYFTCFAVSLSSAIGVAFSANLLTLFIFYEILSFVTYPLVAHKETEEAFAGAKKYLIYLMGTSKTLLLAAIILTYNIAGTLEFSHDGLFGGKGNPALLTVVYFLFIFGFAKAAIMPVHSWLPAAMVAPTPVSALLHAVAVVKVGVFSVLRVIFHVFGPSLMSELNLGVATALLASFTILMASIYALTRDNLKARLAYSTVSQLSYVVLGASLLTPSGMLGGILHIANHAVSKITLFFCAGSIYVASHKINISEMSGIGRKMPTVLPRRSQVGSNALPSASRSFPVRVCPTSSGLLERRIAPLGSTIRIPARSGSSPIRSRIAWISWLFPSSMDRAIARSVTAAINSASRLAMFIRWLAWVFKATIV